MEDTYRVIFRRWKEYPQSVIAFFPDLKGNNYCVDSYMHVGQHSEADYFHCVGRTTPCKLGEYDELDQELITIGYKALRVLRRWPNNA